MSFSNRTRRLLLVLSFALCSALLLLASSPRLTEASRKPASSAAVQTQFDEPADVVAFRRANGGEITPVIVELKGDPVVVQKVNDERLGEAVTLQQLAAQTLQLRDRQNDFLASLARRDVRALLKETDAKQIDGSIRHIEWRFTYLLNGFVIYVATDDLARLQALPEVLTVHLPEPEYFLLDKAIDYSLGTMANVADRRLAVYGATQELSPVGSVGHPETPAATAVDGFEGQGINLAVIDSGIDWRHPMFGGTGLTTPLPRVSGNPPTPADNTRVIYYYNMSSPGDPTDDFGHGTLVASTAAGYKVDGNTPPNPGYGTGRDGTGIGPTINGATFSGTAPQARLMAYKVCGPAPQCLGSTPLSIEDAASPFTLVASGNPGPMPVAKPVADVINLSLGDTAGSAAAASSRAANNAALAGTIVVASAGNSGPGLGTIGAPSAATLAISVAASLDPGSISGSDVLAGGQIPGETSAGKTPAEGAVAGPPEENGPTSEGNAPQAGERQGIRSFPVAGGGSIPGGSVSAHYTFVDLRPAGSTAPVTATNRIAVVKFSGAFAAAANNVAQSNPAAILLITDIESATAVAVVNGIPTYTINNNNGNYLIDLLRTGDPGDGDNNVDVPHGTVSELPLRVSEAVSLAAFQPAMAGFSSRGPNDHPASGFRNIKPDVTGPGVGVAGAATAEGLPDDTVGLASLSGYTQANGTSFSGPITAGAIALVRQRVRDELGLDTTNLNDPNYRNKRFDAVTVARALLQNNATNLRTGLGVPQADGATAASINEMGAGHINVAGALQAKAIMVSPTLLLKDADPNSSGDQREFDVPARNPPALDAQGNLEVMIPTASFGPVPIVGLDATLVRRKKVIIRDVTNGQGGGAYNLTFQDNRNTTNPGFQISFLAADGVTPITSVSVPSGGATEFFVRVAANGNQILIPEFEFQWYVTATQAGSGRTLRMPFYYRAVVPVVPNIVSPMQQPPTNVEQPASDPNCGTDTDGNYTINFTYMRPAGGPTPVGFRLQEATRIEQVFFDNADEPLMPGVSGTTPIVSNTRWTGTQNWRTQPNPSTGSPAYYVPDLPNNQNDTLTMINSVPVPAGGATLSFVTNQDLEENFDFGHVEVSIDNGASYFRIASFTGTFNGTRQLGLAGFAGNAVRIRFRITSDLLNDVPPLGWYIEDIRITADDFQTIAELAANATSQAVTGRTNGTRFYRVGAIFNTANGNVVGPYSNNKCVTVSGVAPPTTTGLQYYPLPRPLRLLDTRSGQPACATPGAPLSGGTERTQNARLTCDGITIPPEALSIVGNATVAGNSSSDGFVTLYPSDVGRPSISNLNYTAGQIVPNAFVVGLGSSGANAGAFNIYASSTTDFIVDVTGYYAPPTPTGLYYHALSRPVRLLDTRGGQPACDAPGQTLTARQARTQQARVPCDGLTIPAGARAVVGNATVVNDTGGQTPGMTSFVTLYPTGVERPVVSNLNYVAGQVVPNAFTVALGADGAFNIYATENINFIVDVTGYYSEQPTDANGLGLFYFSLLSPLRLLDTRAGQPACQNPGAPLMGGAERTQQVRLTCGEVTIPQNALAVIGNATIINNTNGNTGGFVTLYPNGMSRPTVSNLNYVPNQVVPNMFTVGLGASGAFNIYPTSDVNFIVDVAGFFAP